MFCFVYCSFCCLHIVNLSVIKNLNLQEHNTMVAVSWRKLPIGLWSNSSLPFQVEQVEHMLDRGQEQSFLDGMGNSDMNKFIFNTVIRSYKIVPFLH